MISLGKNHLLTAKEVIGGLCTKALQSNGTTCYLNRTLQAQLWAMIEDFIIEIWDAWTDPLTRLLTSCEDLWIHAGMPSQVSHLESSLELDLTVEIADQLVR